MNGLVYSVGGHDGPLVRKSVECYNPDTNRYEVDGGLVLQVVDSGHLVQVESSGRDELLQEECWGDQPQWGHLRDWRG